MLSLACRVVWRILPCTKWRFQTGFFFPLHNFSMPPEVVIIVVQFMFFGINMLWTLLRDHFNPHTTARAKVTLSRA